MECQVHRAIAFSLAVVVLGAIGCSDTGKAKTQKVSGKVTSADGAPVKGASVSFAASSKGFQSTGTTGDDGMYQLSTFGENDGAPEGEYAITVLDSTGANMPVEGKYAATVVAGGNTIDIKVKAPAPGTAPPATEQGAAP